MTSKESKRSERTELGVHLLLFAVAAIILALRSRGAYNDDDIDHYFMARASLHLPAFLVDYWGRAGFTLLYALPAQLGWTGARLFTLLIVLLSAVFTFRAARATGLSRPAVAGALALWQAMVLLLSFSVLTEPFAMLLVAIILDSEARDRPIPAAIAAGILPTVRLELGVVAIVVAGWIVLRHRPSWWALFLMPLPLLLWAAAGALVHGHPLWLLNEIHNAARPLNSMGPLHYFRNLIVVTGPVVFLGLFLGLWNLFQRDGVRPWFAAILWGTLFTLLTLLTWEKLKFGASVGFLRHLIVMAPAGALLAAAGFERAVLAPGARGRWVAAAIALAITLLVALVLSHKLEADSFVVPGHNWWRLAAIAPAAALILATPWLAGRGSTILSLLAAISATFCLITVHPIGLNVEQKVVRQGVDFLVSEHLLDRPLCMSHPWGYLFTGRDRWDRMRTPYTTRAALSAAPAGTIVFWENHYGWRLFGDIMVADLRRSPEFAPLFEAESGDRQFRVVIFEKK